MQEGAKKFFSIIYCFKDESLHVIESPYLEFQSFIDQQEYCQGVRGGFWNPSGYAPAVVTILYVYILAAAYKTY